MRRFAHIIIVVCLALCGVSCKKDFASMLGIDADAPIEMRLYGSNYGWSGDKFSSNAGYFNNINHPEIVIKDDGGFTLDLHRDLESKSGNSLCFNIYINNRYSTFELDHVYSLVLVGDAMASIEFSEKGPSRPLPGGGTVTDIITHRYSAIDGYLIISSMEEYNDDFLISGEFSFRGRCDELDDIVEVRDGKFKDCRVCVSYGKGCNYNVNE